MLLAGCAAAALCVGASPARADRDPLQPNTLIVSTTTYDNTTGAIAKLRVGTTLPSTATSTAQAVAGNNYVTTWNNASVDPSFGVTSAITLLEIDPVTNAVQGKIKVPPGQVVTSFSSKSEGSLHVTGTANPVLTLVGYAGAGVGAIDVSNSNAVPGQDPTDPVSFGFGANYAFPRTIVAMDAHGKFSYTPTIAYGGDNGRGALLGSNGLYYAVGNSNDGDASTFGPGNGTNPDVTETTGVEVVKPINAANVQVKLPAGNSAEIDPLLQFTVKGKLDKPGKDNNYRGIAEYRGALYFTKGSGSNGIDTLYTVSPLPTVASAPQATISIVPGFPTDFAKTTGGNFTPFGIFFANPTTLYVSDEGTGNATDASAHVGIEKWSLVNGTWVLDYVLQNGLKTTDTNLTGPAGQYPDVTTVGLRNLTGAVNSDGMVTLWATTATTSASGDPGADPNKVVRITDVLSAQTATPAVQAEAFQAVIGPTYGTVYRGVAFVGPAQ
jgi:hypothetical protein